MKTTGSSLSVADSETCRGHGPCSGGSGPYTEMACAEKIGQLVDTFVVPSGFINVLILLLLSLLTPTFIQHFQALG